MTVMARAALVMLCALTSAMAACSSARPLASPEEVYASTQGRVDRGDYRLQAGDRLNIKFPFHELANQQIPVRPDGKISLEVTGEILAEGLTPRELEAVIRDRSSHRLRDPEVVVIVLELGERKAFVGGEVTKPGFVVVSDGMTPLQAVIAAGGFKDTAKKDHVLYMARKTDGTYQASRVDLADVVKNGTPETVRLAGNDVVFVPATLIAKMNTFMDQYVRKLLPVDSKAGASAALPVP